MADFIGRSNLLRERVVDSISARPGAACQVECTLGHLRCIAPAGAQPGDIVSLAIRPEHFELTPQGDAGENAIEGTLESAAFIGTQMECVLRTGEQRLKVLLHPGRVPPIGQLCTLYVSPDHCLALKH